MTEYICTVIQPPFSNTFLKSISFYKVILNFIDTKGFLNDWQWHTWPSSAHISISSLCFSFELERKTLHPLHVPACSSISREHPSLLFPWLTLTRSSRLHPVLAFPVLYQDRVSCCLYQKSLYFFSCNTQFILWLFFLKSLECDLFLSPFHF